MSFSPQRQNTFTDLVGVVCSCWDVSADFRSADGATMVTVGILVGTAGISLFTTEAAPATAPAGGHAQTTPSK